jgi:hypothetical protein
MPMKIWKNKRGDGYVFPCVMIIVLCMLMSVFIFFYSTASWIRVTKENAETVMDSYIMKNSIEIYNSIKQGNDYTEALDANVYIDDLCRFCTLVKGSSYLYHYDSDGRLQYRMSRPVITFRQENTLKIQISYTLYVTVYFNNRPVTNAVVPVTVVSALSEKF